MEPEEKIKKQPKEEKKQGETSQKEKIKKEKETVLGPNNQVPDGITDEGAANLAKKSNKKGEIEKLAKQPPKDKEKKATKDPNEKDDNQSQGQIENKTDIDAKKTKPNTNEKGKGQNKEQPKDIKKGQGEETKKQEVKDSENKEQKPESKSGGKSEEGKDKNQEVAGNQKDINQQNTADSGGGGGGGGGFDIEFIAREYAIHEQWERLPADKDQLVKEYSGKGNAQSPTLTIEQRKELLNKAMVGGGLSGAAQFGLSLALKIGLEKGTKLLVSKGLGKAVPFIGLAFSGWDLYTFFAQGKHKSLSGLGKIGKVFTGKATRKDWIEFLKGVKSLFDLLAAILGVASGIIGVLAVFGITAPVCVPLAAGLAIASGVLGILSTLLTGAITYLEYQEILTMEGSPEEIMAEITKFEGDVASLTEGILNMPGRIKGISKELKTAQKKTTSETTPKGENSKGGAGTQTGPEKGQGLGGGENKPQSQILLAGEENTKQSLPNVGQPDNFERTKGGLYCPKSAGDKSNIVTSDAPQGFEQTKSGLYVPKSSQGQSMVVSPESPKGFERTESGLYVPKAPEGYQQTGSGLYVPKPPEGYKTSESGLYVPKHMEEPFKPKNPKGPNIKRTVQQFDNWFGDGKGVNIGPVVISDKVPIEAIAQKEMPTNRPDVTYKPDNQGGKLIRRANLAPLPAPPYNLENTVGRLKKVADLAYQEEGLVEALRVGKEGEKRLDKELGPGGTSQEIMKTYQEYMNTIKQQESEVRSKDAKVKNSEQLLEEQKAKDQQTKGKADEVLNNSAVRKLGEVTSDPVLSAVVRGGATVGKAVAGAVNWVASNVFGKKEDVIDTKVIDNVKQLFSVAPEARSRRGKCESNSGKAGSSAQQTAPQVQENRAKVNETKTKHQETKGKVGEFNNAGKTVTNTITEERQSIANDNQKYEAQLQKVRAERQQEHSLYMSEMNALSLWAVQHRSIRDANMTLIDDMKQPPKVEELTDDAKGKIENAQKAILEAKDAITKANEKMKEIAEKAGQSLESAAIQMGTTSGSVAPIKARLIAEAENQYKTVLAPQLGTLDSALGMLGSVAPERLAGVIEAGQRIAKSAQLSAEQTVSSFNALAQKVTDAVLQQLQQEISRKKRVKMTQSMKQ